MSQQEFLRMVMFRLGFTRDGLAARLHVSRRGLDKWLLPSESADFREMPEVARAFIDEIFAKYQICVCISPVGIYNELCQLSVESSMGYKAITPAADWFFVVFPVAPQNELVVWRVPVWALNDEGDVVGLVSVPGGSKDDPIMGATCKLVAPPPLRGVYKHESELTPDEKTAVATNKPVKVQY